MISRTRVIGLLAGATLAVGLARPAHAERVRFHYAPNMVTANAPMTPGAPGLPGAPPGPGTPSVVGERVSAFGGTEPVPCQLRPTQIVTFRHYYSGQMVSVPLRLPQDIPLVQHRANRTIFNYGSYSVETVFLPDGSVDVVYNTGFLGRRLGWCARP